MKWIMLLSVLTWLSAWIAIAGWFAARRQGEALVKLFHNGLPVMSATSFLLLFAAVPKRGTIYPLVLWMHHAALFGLFAFLLGAELFLTQVWWQIRANVSAESIAATVRRLWILTEFAPAPLALAIFLTGLRLIWESPANTPDSLWLMILVIGFSFFFFDGLLGYAPVVRGMRAYWETAARERTSVLLASEAWHSTPQQLQLAAHCLSWPLLFMVGITRWEHLNWFSRQVLWLQSHLTSLPDGWARVATAIALWALSGLLVVLIRTCFRFRH